MLALRRWRLKLASQKKRLICALVLGATTSLMTACGGAGGKSLSASDICLGRNLLPPSPFFFLDYPPNGSTNIPTNAGVLIEIGADNGQYPNASVSVTSASGPVPVGVPAALPSPLPTPFATPTPNSGKPPFVAIPLPTLFPNTIYTVAATYTGYADNPPSCSAPITQTLGTFTTGQ